jgi:hypothetical protein
MELANVQHGVIEVIKAEDWNYLDILRGLEITEFQKYYRFPMPKAGWERESLTNSEGMEKEAWSAKASQKKIQRIEICGWAKFIWYKNAFYVVENVSIKSFLCILTRYLLCWYPKNERPTEK